MSIGKLLIDHFRHSFPVSLPSARAALNTNLLSYLLVQFVLTWTCRCRGDEADSWT